MEPIGVGTNGRRSNRVGIINKKLGREEFDIVTLIRFRIDIRGVGYRD